MPGVSIIVPCFNAEATLRRAVASALTQSHLCEILIVDDCSTDGSAELVAAMASEEPRIRSLRTPRNSGPGAARNLGVGAAAGDYVSFLDADDELVGDLLGETVALMQSQPELSVIKADMEFFDPVKGYVLPSFDPRYPAVALSSACGLVMRKNSFLLLGGFPADLAFRGPHGGEDVAFMTVVKQYLQPIGRISRPAYRCWSSRGSHLDRFLSATRLTDDSFEFVRLLPDQLPGGALDRALAAYMEAVARRWGANS